MHCHIIIIIIIIQNMKRVTTSPSKSLNRYVKERQCEKYTANEKGECGMYTLGVKSIVPYLSYPASQPWSLSIQWSELRPSPYVLFPQPPPPSQLSPLMYVSIVFTNQGPYWEADSSSGNQEIITIPWNPKVHCRVHKNPQSD